MARMVVSSSRTAEPEPPPTTTTRATATRSNSQMLASTNVGVSQNRNLPKPETLNAPVTEFLFYSGTGAGGAFSVPSSGTQQGIYSYNSNEMHESHEKYLKVHR